MSSSSHANGNRREGWLERIARVQAMLGVPLIVVLFVLHIGLSNTAETLVNTQFALYQSNSALQKSALLMVQARHAAEAATAGGDVELMYRAVNLLDSSLAMLEEGVWHPPTRLQVANPVHVDAQVAQIRGISARLATVGEQMARNQSPADLSDVPARLETLYHDFREQQSRHERSVFEIHARLALQQQRYEWAVRATLVLLLSLYAGLSWLYVSQRRAAIDLREARDTAERTARAKSDFLAVMSHEIRTPLNGVLGVADLLDTPGLTPEQREYIKVIRESGGHLLRVIDDIMDFSRIESERITLEEEAFDLREVVAQLRTLLAGILKPEVSLEVSIGDDVPDRLLGDRTRYTQVIGNLLKNALKYTDQGEVMLDIDATDRDEIVIRVRDTGAGIEAGKIAAIHEPFTQADGSIVRAYGGTGLGLAITRRIVELMHGEITARTVPGHGTEFVVHLPIRRPPPAGEAPAVPGRPTASRRSLAVLVVEDNPVNQMVTRRMLESLGHRVEIAVDGEEGVARARAGHFDLVLMDLQMPRMSGITATESLRRAGTRSRIVALSANAMPEHRQAAQQAGMDGFLAKPARLADIERLLRDLFPESPAGGN